MKICNIPAILASYANPTPQTLLLATPDITPAQLLPCLSREIVLKLVEITDVSQMQQAVGLDKCNNGHNWKKKNTNAIKESCFFKILSQQEWIL